MNVPRTWPTVGQQGHQVIRRTLRPVGSTLRFRGSAASDFGKRAERVPEEALTVGQVWICAISGVEVKA